MSDTSRFLAVDPGETTGWAIFKGPLVTVCGEASREEFTDVLVEEHVDFYVVEDWLLNPKEAPRLYWNKIPAARVLGEVEHVARVRAKKIYYQKSAIKPLAAAKFNLPNNGSHMMDAVLHGTWFMRKDEVPDAEEQLPEQRPSPPERGVRRPARVTSLSSYGGLRRAWREAGVEMPKGRRP